MLSAEAVGFSIRITTGLIKLTRRVDLVLAEKGAIQAPMSIPVPNVALGPTQSQMRKALRKFLSDTRDEDPDPLGKDRKTIHETVENNPRPLLLTQYMQTYLPEQALGRVFNLNGAFMKALREARPDLAEDPDLRVAAFYVGAGGDFRNRNYPWRFALTVVDVLTEFGVDNMALFTRDRRVQSIAGAVLKRFAVTDIQTIDTTRDLLRSALSATLNGIFEARETFDSGSLWIETLLDALSSTREAIPEEERDDFLIGLFQGKAYPVLVSNLMEKTAGHLNDDNVEDFKDIVDTFLKEVAHIIKQKPRFESFFNDHWGDLLGAGLASLEQHGPALLKGKSPLLTNVLVAIVGDLAKRPSNKVLTSDALVGIVGAAVSAVAINPDLLSDTIHEKWVAELVGSIASTISQAGIRQNFTRYGLESLVMDTLDTYAKHPELIIEKPGLARELLKDVLTSLSNMETLASEELAAAAVGGALSQIAKHPELLKFNYSHHVASLAGKVGTLVKERKLTKVQGVDILRSFNESLSENLTLFLDLEKRMAGWTVDAVLNASQGSKGRLLAGVTLNNVLQEVVKALAKSGKTALKNHPAATLAGQLENVITAGLSRAETELGNILSLSALPDVLGELVMKWAGGEIETIDPNNDNFQRLFDEIARQHAA